jgi:hypothetical protein
MRRSYRRSGCAQCLNLQGHVSLECSYLNTRPYAPRKRRLLHTKHRLTSQKTLLQQGCQTFKFLKSKLHSQRKDNTLLAYCQHTLWYSNLTCNLTKTKWPSFCLNDMHSKQQVPQSTHLQSRTHHHSPPNVNRWLPRNGYKSTQCVQHTRTAAEVMRARTYRNVTAERHCHWRVCGIGNA